MKIIDRIGPTPAKPGAKPLPAARAPEAVIQLQLPPPLQPDGSFQFNGTGCLDEETIARIEEKLAEGIEGLDANLRPSFDIVCVELPPQSSSTGPVTRRATTIGLWFPALGDDVDPAAALASVNLLAGTEADTSSALLRSELSRTLLQNLIGALAGDLDRENVVIRTTVQFDAAKQTVTTVAAVHRRKRDDSAGLKYVELRWKETPKRDQLGEVCPPRPPIFAITDRRFDRFLERDHRLNFIDRWVEDVGRAGVLGELLALIPFPKRIPAGSFVALLTGVQVFPSLVVNYDEPRVEAARVVINGRIGLRPARLPCVAIREESATGPASFDAPTAIEVQVPSNETDAEVTLALRAEVFDVRGPTIRWQVEGANPSSATGSGIVIRVPTAQLRPFGQARVTVTATAEDTEFDAATNLPPRVQGRRQVVFKMLAVAQPLSA